MPTLQRRKLRPRESRARPRLERKGVLQVQEGLRLALPFGKDGTEHHWWPVLGTRSLREGPTLDKSKRRHIRI